jgi:hypothetical protein
MITDSSKTPDEQYQSNNTAREVVLEFLSKLNTKKLAELCNENDLEYNQNELLKGDEAGARKLVFELISEQIGIFDAAEKLSEEIILNFFSRADLKSIDALCERFDLPKVFFRQKTYDEDIQNTRDLFSKLDKYLPDDEDLVSLAKNIGIKYLDSKSDTAKTSRKLKRITWDDVGEYLTENELASLIGCSVKTLRNNRSQHKGMKFIKDVNVGSIRYSKKDVLEYMKRHTIDPEQQ